MPLGELSALAAAATWAIGSLLFARIGKRVSPGAMNLGKCLAAAVLLSLVRVALAPSIGPIRLSGAIVLPLAVSGLVGLTIGDTAYFGAIAALGVPRAILILSSAPVFAALGGVLFLGERVGGREAGGIALTLAGIALVVAARSPVALVSGAPGALAEAGTAEARRRIRRGIALGVVAAMGQAGGNLLARRAMSLGIDPLGAAATRLVAGVLGLVVSALVLGHAGPWVRELREGRAWAKVAGASLIGTFGGIWLSQLALANCSSTGVATTLLATSPMFALPLAHFAGHERITSRGIAGTLIAIGGVVLLSLRGA